MIQGTLCLRSSPSRTRPLEIKTGCHVWRWARANLSAALGVEVRAAPRESVNARQRERGGEVRARPAGKCVLVLLSRNDIAIPVDDRDVEKLVTAVKEASSVLDKVLT